MKKTMLFISLLVLMLMELQVPALAGANRFLEADDDCTVPGDTSSSDKSPENFLSVLKKISLSGFTQIRYQYIDNSASVNGFDIRRARLNFKGDIAHKVSYDLQLELAGTPKILDAYGAYAFNRYLKITLGQFKVPMSYENFYLDRSTLISINGAQAVEALTGNSTDELGNFNGRDIGGMVSGSYGGGKKFNVIEYYAGIFNGNGTNPYNNTEKSFAGRLVVQPVNGLSFGGFYYKGTANYAIPNTKDPIENHIRDRWGVQLVYTNNRITFNSEFLQGVDGNHADKAGNITRQGYYAQLAGFIIRKKLQLFVKYDNYDADTNATNDGTTVYTLGVNYYFTKITRIMLNYEWHREQGIQINNDTFIAEFQVGF